MMTRAPGSRPFNGLGQVELSGSTPLVHDLVRQFWDVYYEGQDTLCSSFKNAVREVSIVKQSVSGRPVFSHHLTAISD